MKSIAILTPYFPPATLAGVHRARHLAKYLSYFGWQPWIVRAHERFYAEILDPDLSALVPGSVFQVRTAAISAPLARRFGVGDIGLRGYGGFRAALTDLARRKQIDAVLITGSPFYPMLLAKHIRDKLGLPVILDFQDPWVSGNCDHSRWSKPGIAHRLAVALEPAAVRHASFITSVSERQNDEMAARYPWLDRSMMAAIPIGGDPDDFEALRSRPPGDRQVRLDPTKTNISYVGTFLPRAGPLVRTLFAALAELRAEQPGISKQVRLNFVGTSNQTSGLGSHLVKPIAVEAGVADLVHETPQRVPYLEALSVLANSSGLLMIGSDEPHYTASKIYPNLMAARPYISIFHAESSAHEVLAAAGGGINLAFSTEDQLRALREPLRRALKILIDQPECFDRPDPAAYAPFTAYAVAGQFAKIFDRVVQP